MNVRVIGKNINPTESIKSKIESKMEKLQQYLNVDTDVKVTISAKKEEQTVEVTVAPIKGPIIRAEDSQRDLYSAIDIVYDKLYKQLRKYKTRAKNRKNSHQSIRFENIEDYNFDDVIEEKDIHIERIKKFSIKPMSSEEAILQMELLGHDFYMFRNSETDKINTVYKRHGLGYGIIEEE
ncbi:MAG: ribosome-associated translation inhibitor RaiA [Romboutsia sp.]|uniref:ribosome hibernation-promoting factor, HPF/YfiA family n=1 Tax=Paraclostridium sp. TaxID=2023273 RepID=UPI003AA5CACE